MYELYPLSPQHPPAVPFMAKVTDTTSAWSVQSLAAGQKKSSPTTNQFYEYSHLFPVLLESYKSSPKNNPVWGAGGFPRLRWTCTGNPRKFAGQILWFPVGFPKKTKPMTDQQPQSAPPYVVQQAPADPWAAATRGVRTPGWKQASEHVEHLRPQSIHYPWWNEKLLGKL